MSNERHAFARLAAALALLAACRPAPSPQAPQPEPGQPQPTQAVTPRPTPVNAVVPAPMSAELSNETTFRLDSTTAVVVDAGPPEAAGVGEWLARRLRPATGFAIPVSTRGGPAAAGAIALRLDRGRAGQLGDEGYELRSTRDSVVIVAAAPAGLFRGVQTLRQLLPAGIEAEQSALRVASAWTVPTGVVVDRPRFAWRGAMLDVARHFFTVDEVKQYIDVLALYKLNTLHLHLSDDQGWRIQIDSRPRLTEYGGSTQVGGGPGGFYTKADYAEIVRYARERFITIVPEIDMPGHTHAAIASYPEIGCSRPMPDRPDMDVPGPGLYTGIRVGWSTVCHDREATYQFVEDVVRELAAMTPGPYLHLGGDEVEALTHEQYAAFVERVQEIVERHGKRMVGWEEIGKARLRPGTIAQMWRGVRNDSALLARRQGNKLVMSPGPKTYLDMKYTPATELGLRWAGFIELRTAYDWDPVTFYPGTSESQVLGVEAPLWSETIENITAAMYLAMPRLPAIAEVGWSTPERKDWEGFRARIAAHAPRWRLLGVNYYPSPQVEWY